MKQNGSNQSGSRTFSDLASTTLYNTSNNFWYYHGKAVKGLREANNTVNGITSNIHVATALHVAGIAVLSYCMYLTPYTVYYQMLPVAALLSVKISFAALKIITEEVAEKQEDNNAQYGWEFLARGTRVASSLAATTYVFYVMVQSYAHINLLFTSVAFLQPLANPFVISVAGLMLGNIIRDLIDTILYEILPEDLSGGKNTIRFQGNISPKGLLKFVVSGWIPVIPVKYFMQYMCDEIFNFTSDITFKTYFDQAGAAITRFFSGLYFINEYTGSFLDHLSETSIGNSILSFGEHMHASIEGAIKFYITSSIIGSWVAKDYADKAYDKNREDFYYASVSS